MLKLLFKPIGCLATILTTLLVIAAIALIALFWLGEAWTPKFVGEWIEQRSGFDVQIDDANVGLFAQELTFEDIVVRNPPTYPEESFLRIRKLAIKLPLTDVADGEFRAQAVDMAIDTLTIVIPPHGPSNISAFIDAVNYQPPPPLALDTAATSPRLESFTLQINDVVIEDHTYRRPEITRVKVNYSGSFSDVSRSLEVFPEVERGLREADVSGLGPAFFQALFATLPIQCFEDIAPAAPDLLPEKINKVLNEHGDEAKKALESI